MFGVRTRGAVNVDAEKLLFRVTPCVNIFSVEDDHGHSRDFIFNQAVGKTHALWAATASMKPLTVLFGHTR